jgi:hypothetical protein
MEINVIKADLCMIDGLYSILAFYSRYLAYIIHQYFKLNNN